MTDDPVLAAYRWPTNAHLMVDCVRLGYLREDWLTLDPTYGKGVWWKHWRPAALVCHDKFLGDGVDFRRLPEPDATFDAVAFDPPYVCTGGRRTTTMPEFHARYGIGATAPRTPAELQALICGGLTEAARVVKPRGMVLVKCQDYISSGKLWIGTHHTLTHALSLGFEAIDRMERVQPNPRPQPSSCRRQVHARRNLSTLFVLRAPKVAQPPPPQCEGQMVLPVA